MKMRTTKPEKGNKFYITTDKGGYSTCVYGNPTDKTSNVLSNCVGYACGRFNEIIGKMKYPSLNCNAENFIEKAKNTYGLKVVPYPTLGGILVWQGGATLSGKDGAGHVAIVERIDSANQIYTSESSWGGAAFFNATRKNTNGKWGLASAYKFRGCIINPEIGDIHWEEKVTPNVQRDETKDQIEVFVEQLRVRVATGTDKEVLGFATKGFYDLLETKKDGDYVWAKIADGQWIATKDDWTKIYPKKEPEPKTEFFVGDKVVVTGRLYGASDGGAPGSSVKNYHTTIALKTNLKAKAPYNIYNSKKQYLGWVEAKSIKEDK